MLYLLPPVPLDSTRSKGSRFTFYDDTRNDCIL
jgi:hypothetical protein